MHPENLDETRERQNKMLLAENNPLQLYPESLDELMALNFPPRQWLVDGLLPAQAVTILSASSNSYKTWLMLEMALCMANGTAVFGELKTKPANVLIVDEESQPNGLHERFRQLKAPKGLPIWWLSRRLHKITDEGYVDSIVSRCAALNIDLVIFDSLIRMHSGEENSSRDMAKVMDAFKTIADFGSAVLIAHHTRKEVPGNYNPDNSMRGSSDILAAVDCHLAMRRINGGEYVELKQTKNRFQRPAPPMKLHFTELDGRTGFQLVELLQSANDRISELKEAVLRLIETEPGIYKKLMLAKLSEQQVEIEERKLAALLKELVSEQKLITKPGQGTTVHYFLTNTEDAETEHING